MSSAVPREMGQHAQAAASSELHNGGKGVPRGHPFSLTEGIPISELHLPSVPAVAFGGQARAFSLSGSLSATWGTQA